MDTHVTMWQRKELAESEAMRHAAVAITHKLSSGGGGKKHGRRSAGGRRSRGGRRPSDSSVSTAGSSRPGSRMHGGQGHAADAGGETGQSRVSLQGAVGFNVDEEEEGTGGGQGSVSKYNGGGSNTSSPAPARKQDGHSKKRTAGKQSGTNSASDADDDSPAHPEPPPAAAKLVGRLGTVATTGALSGEAPTGQALRASIQDMARRAAPSFEPPMGPF